jgi:hypothetical protein
MPVKSLALLSAAACVPTYAVVQGQAARVPAPGAAEASVTAGLTAFAMSVPTATPSLVGPSMEANFLAGIADGMALSLHGSPVGLAPGIKVSLLREPLDLALLAQASLGYNQSTDVRSGRRSDLAAILFAGGARLFASSRGFYGGVGAGFEWAAMSSAGLEGIRSAGPGTALNVNAAFGYEWEAGALALRLEVAGLFSTNGIFTFSQGAAVGVFPTGSMLWLVLPSLTVAVGGAAD